MSDLELALSTLHNVERSRAEAWRTAAHDLRGSVTVVKGATTLLNEGGAAPFRTQSPGIDEAHAAPLAQEIHNATEVANDARETSTDRRRDMAPAATLPSQSEAAPQEQQPGEGVGLSIVKRLCELLDTGLELETKPGQGSTFRVILPRSYDDRSA